MLSTFERLQVPIEQSKLEGPATCLTFLGIEIDTEHLQQGRSKRSGWSGFGRTTFQDPDFKQSKFIIVHNRYTVLAPG